MRSLAPRVPQFDGSSASGAFLGEVEGSRMAGARLAQLAFSGKAKLEDYKDSAQEAIRAAGRNKQPGQVMPWNSISNAASQLASSFFQPRQPAPAASPSGGWGSGGDLPSFWPAASGMNTNTIVNTAFSQPQTFAGGGFSAPNFWGGASGMDTNTTFKNSFLNPIF